MKIALYIIWALFVAGVVFSIVRLSRKTKRRQQLTASWPRVQAIVTGSVAGWTNGGGGSSRSRRFYPTYQFADPRGTLFAGESEVSYANQPAPGSSVEVMYNPINPNQSFQVSSQDSTVIGCLIPCFAAIAAGSFLFISIVPVS
ncbi:DUF3592 domain-containing protein [Arthrobacter sp. B10-11]|uniref:DUF3592 domain-containing protein n=1 Tax=Arthrobacter sp. B10-11 TaxID=3081160 RepID=UPI002953BC57|nr:DUF3592 domain-containing protein [Arthrobacter sp. B10-11]MDV8147843.1 DUF3592 domain-containing protein [Arthrobacter sp. B10-11]